MKLNNSQSGFFTIADLLAKQGYNTSFIYGGEKHFDNMAASSMAAASKYYRSKGLSKSEIYCDLGRGDEDLFDKANRTLTQLQNEGKPFFSLVFGSSNHDPFEFPDGKIGLYDNQKQPVITAQNMRIMPLVISSN